MAFNGLPGIGRKEEVSPEMQAMLLTDQGPRIGKQDIIEAAEILSKYKRGKENLEKRIIEDEEWYKLRHWEVIRREKGERGPEPASAWLFNAILNKHADAMDNYPEPVVLPRERSDEQSAKILSSVLPVVMEYGDFEKVYADNWWEKLKHGTAVYGTFWNNEKENGLGDVDVRSIDLLKIFWEPGISDIQDSKNLFIVDLVDEETLKAEYPEYKGKLKGKTIDVAQYQFDDHVNNDEKEVVVDWYYRVKTAGGATVLHYCKFVGETLLYASENDSQYSQTGWYEHGKYPVHFDVLFPEKGTPCGFGYVAICKDPQLYIDKLSANILESSLVGSKPRFFVSTSTNINENDLLDVSKAVVPVEGELSDTRVKQIKIDAPDGIYYNVLQGKIEEMKDTAANRDVNSGGSGSGVTAAAAIAALQEAGNKASRDMIAASYRVYTKICAQMIDLMRQFYTEERSFRITGQDGNYQFVQMGNAGLADQVSIGPMGQQMFRRPVFDLKIKAQKKNPFSRMEQNERAKELYAAGFFSPDRAQEAMGALEMMDFEGIDKVKEYVRQGNTLYNMVQQLMGQNMKMMAALGLQPPAPQGGAPAPATEVKSNPVTDGVLQAQTPMTGYGQALAERSKPSV